MAVITLQKDQNKLSLKKGQHTVIVNSANEICVELGQDSDVDFILAASQGWEGKPIMTFELNGSNSNLNFIGIVLGQKDYGYDFETVAKHIAPETKANFLIQSGMFDDSHIDFKGNLNIGKEGMMTDTYLAHHTLLMSKKARAKTIPALEIEADDVKAGHAATVGKVDKDLMFYLQSRGINKKTAERILVEGFFASALEKIKDEATKENIRELISGFLKSKNI